MRRRRSSRFPVLFGIAIVLLTGPVLAAEFDVSRYDIQVEVRPDSIRAEVTLTATAGKLPKTWLLQLADTMQIRSLSVNGKEVGATRKGWDLRLDLSKLPAAAGELTLKAVVEGSPRYGGGGRKSTRISPEHARIRSQQAWYPRVKDDAATYRTVISVDKDWLARTAGRQTGKTESGDRRVFTWEQDLPVRAIGFVAGPYTVTSLDPDSGFVCQAWTLPGHADRAKWVLGVASGAIGEYRARFGKIRLPGYAVIEMPPEYGAMSGYGEAGYILLGSGVFAPEGGALTSEMLIAHEVAHTWWGQEVGFRNFAHETLASYATLGHIAAVSGEEAARREREKAIRAVLGLAGGESELSFDEIAPFGAGMAPEVYQALAYEKGMMLLAMVEDAGGRKAMDKALAGFFKEHRGRMVGWPELRTALRKAGSAARTVVDQWESPGIPKLVVEHTAAKSGKGWKVKGTIIQSGTKKPFRMTVHVAGIQGTERVEKEIAIRSAKTPFTLMMAARPDRIVLDPEWRLLVDAPRAAFDAEEVIKRADLVVSDPGNRDQAACEATIGLLRDLLARGAGNRETWCRASIGRLEFRLGRNDEARASLEGALKAGVRGFHENWVRLRLGNLADLAGERAKAEEYYRTVAASQNGNSGYQIKLAKGYLKTPYR